MKLDYPGSGLYLSSNHLVTGEMVKIRENARPVASAYWRRSPMTISVAAPRSPAATAP